MLYLFVHITMSTQLTAQPSQVKPSQAEPSRVRPRLLHTNVMQYILKLPCPLSPFLPLLPYGAQTHVGFVIALA